MSKFLYYPVKNRINESNLFGANSAEYKPLGQNGHPGNDYESPTGTKIFAPCDGVAFYTSDSLGGDGIWIRHTDEDGKNYNIILWHMPVLSSMPLPGVASAVEYPFQIPTDRSMIEVKAGQFLGYTDNSGYGKESTGPHLHLGIMPADSNWHALSPNNGFLGCVDPASFYNGDYAENINTHPIIASAIQQASDIVSQVQSSDAPASQKLSFLQQIQEILKELENML